MSHVLNIHKNEGKKTVLGFALGKLKELKDKEFNDQNEESEDDSENELIFQAYDNIVPQLEYISADELKLVFETIVEKNVLWDAGL